MLLGRVNNENVSKLWKLIQEAGDYLSRQRYSLVQLYSAWFTVVMRNIYNS
jgi:hypothetical protein